MMDLVEQDEIYAYLYNTATWLRQVLLCLQPYLLSGCLALVFSNLR